MHAHVHADAGARNQKIAWFLEAQFGEVELHSDPDHAPVVIVQVDESEARVNLMSSVRYLVGASTCADRLCFAGVGGDLRE